MTEPLKKGELYSRQYVERGAPLSDSVRFRNRLGQYFADYLHYDPSGKVRSEKFRTAITRELGVPVPLYGGSFSVSEFFRQTPEMRDALSAITIIYKELWEYQHDPLTNGWRLRPGSAASQWQEFVARALRDENLAYTLDDQCGVHPLVDVEFERNSAATVRSLGEARYAAVRTAFEAGKSKLDALPQDRKGAIRDLFEAVETLTKLVSNSGKALDSGFVRGEIQRIVARLHAEDAVARRSGGAMCLSLADWVDAAHPYRHGQQVEEPVEPPEELTVLIFSQGAAFIRWLVDIDQQENGGGT